MATSQNGYAVHKSSADLRKWVIPGTGRHLYLRDDKAGFVLACMAYELAHRVEKPSRTWDWWGWAYRAIRGALTGYSNHASATGFDFNAIQHPLGALPSSNFTSKQIATIQALLRAARYNGTVRWGGNYSGRKDGMHFEINRAYDYVAVAAERLAAHDVGRRVLEANPGGFHALRRIAKPDPKPAPSKPAPTPAPTKKPAPKLPVVDLSAVKRQARTGGDRQSASVRRLQRALINKKLLGKGQDDGYFGRKTKSAYRKWQKKLGYKGSDADGVPGKVSLTKLGRGLFRVQK